MLLASQSEVLAFLFRGAGEGEKAPEEVKLNGCNMRAAERLIHFLYGHVPDLEMLHLEELVELFSGAELWVACTFTMCQWGNLRFIFQLSSSNSERFSDGCSSQSN